MKDNLLLQKRRAAENLMSLLKDLNEIGAMFSSDLDLKVRSKVTLLPPQNEVTAISPFHLRVHVIVRLQVTLLPPHLRSL